MSDTPEKDAAWLEQKDMVILCRKLERERDDLLSQDYRTEARAMRYCQERDEARELAQQMSESNQVLQAEVRDYRKKERATS